MKMPYHLEKGPTFSVLESVLNAPNGQANLLAQLRDNTVELATVIRLDEWPPPIPFFSLEDHLNQHWLGRRRASPGGPWQPQPSSPWPPVVGGKAASTGYWYQYAGNVEEILRVAFIRAVEVSIGVDHSRAPVNGPITQTHAAWPIEVLWKCPQAWFETWVTWRQQPTKGTGQVTVVICTPAHFSDNSTQLAAVRSSPLSTTTDPSYAVEPLTAQGPQGMWVVTHRNHLMRSPNLQGSTTGDWTPQVGGAWYGAQFAGVVTVQVAESDGGVKNPPRAI